MAWSDGNFFFLRLAFLYFPWWEGYKALLLGGVLRARHVLGAARSQPKTPRLRLAYSLGFGLLMQPDQECYDLRANC